MALAQAQGLTIQKAKCCYLLPEKKDLVSPSIINTLEAEGLVNVSESHLHLLGAAISSYNDIEDRNESIQDWTYNAAITKNRRFFTLLTHRDMPVQIGFRLLCKSGLPRLSYLCRVMPPHIMKESVQAFDTLIQQTLMKMFRLFSSNNTVISRISEQMHLKLRQGGLGIPSFSSISPAAYIASLASAFPAINDLFDELGTNSPSVQRAQRSYKRHFDAVKSDIASNADADAINKAMPSLDCFKVASPTTVELQKKLSAAIAAKRQRSVSSTISAADQARLLSASQPAAKLWLSTVPEEKGLTLTDVEFRAAIKLRLSIPSLPSSAHYFCACDPAKRIINDTHHSHVCDLIHKSTGFSRHEAIVSTLADLARSTGHSARFKNEFLVRKTEKEKNIQPDLFVYAADGTRYMIDVSITAPDADSYLKLRSNTVPLAAAKNRENVKDKDYEKLAQDNEMILVPFVMETHGAVGTKAKDFLTALSKNTMAPSQFYIYALRRLAVALQRANARVQAEGNSLLSFRAAGSSSMVEISGAVQSTSA